MPTEAGDILKWIGDVRPIVDNAIGVALMRGTDFAGFLALRVYLETPDGAAYLSRPIASLRRFDRYRKAIPESFEPPGILFLEFPPEMPIRAGSRVVFAVHDPSMNTSKGYAYKLFAPEMNYPEIEKRPPEYRELVGGIGRVFDSSPNARRERVIPDAIPLKANLPFLSVLREQVRAGHLAAVDVDRIVEVFDEIGARFRGLGDIEERDALEAGLASVLNLSASDAKTWIIRTRGRYSRSHEMTVIHIRIDIYTESLPPQRSLATRIVHAFLMTQVESHGYQGPADR